MCILALCAYMFVFVCVFVFGCVCARVCVCVECMHLQLCFMCMHVCVFALHMCFVSLGCHDPLCSTLSTANISISPLTGCSSTPSINLDLVVLQWHPWQRPPAVGEGSRMCHLQLLSRGPHHFSDVTRVFP